MKALFRNALIYFCKLINIRFVALNTHRIGHLAWEFDCHIKLKKLGLIKNSIDIVHSDGNQDIANLPFAKYWDSFFVFPKSKLSWKLINFVAADPSLRLSVQDYCVAINETATYYEAQSKWGLKKPIIAVTKKDMRKGQTFLKKFGLNDTDWYVCVHAREDGFAPGEQQEYRNSKIENYGKAIDFIIDQGGWVFRMGDPSMSLLPFKHKKVIDYAHCNLKSPFLDFFLSATCRLFLGSCSGLGNIPITFGIPTIFVDLCPMSMALASNYQGLSLFKIMVDKKTNQPIPFREVLDSPISNFRYQHQFDDKNIVVQDNTEDEILGVTKELYQKSFCNNQYEITALQKKFNSLLKKGHYTFGSNGLVSSKFLEKHQTLL